MTVAPVAPDQLVKPLADPVRGAPIYPMAPVVHLCGGPLDGQCVTLRSEHRPAPGVFYWIPRAAMHAGEGLALIEQQPGDDAVARLVHHGPGMRHGYVVTHDTCSSGHPVLEYQTTTGEPPAPTA